MKRRNVCRPAGPKSGAGRAWLPLILVSVAACGLLVYLYQALPVSVSSQLPESGIAAAPAAPGPSAPEITGSSVPARAVATDQAEEPGAAGVPALTGDLLGPVTRLLGGPDELDIERLDEMIDVAADPALPLPERVAAIDWLARLGNDAAIEALRRLSRDDTDAAIRGNVADALGESAHPAATEILLGLLADPDLDVVLSAVDGLAGRMDPGVRRILLALVGDQGQPQEVRAAAAQALGQYQDSATDLLLAYEASPEAVSGGVLGGLARQNFGDSEAVFRRLFEDPNTPFELKIDAIDALAQGSADAAGFLLELARDDPDPELRAAAVDALTFAEASDATLERLPQLALSEPSAEVRASLYNTLAMHAGRAVSEANASRLVSSALGETEPQTRLEAYRLVASMLNYDYRATLAETFDSSMVSWLQREAEYSDDRYTRFMSIDALRLANTAGARRALGDLRYADSAEVSRAAADALRMAERTAGGGSQP